MSRRFPKTCKELQVSTVEAQEAIWQLAPRDWIGKRKAAIRKLARDLGWTFPRTWNIAHGRARRIDASEMDQLRFELLEQLKERANESRGKLNALIYERHALARAGYSHLIGDSGATGGRQGEGTGGSEGEGIEPTASSVRST